MWSKHWSITVVSCASGQSVTADRHTECVFRCPLPHTPSPELPDYPRINNLSPNFISMYDTGVSAEYGDKLITLSTCEYSQANSRLVVVAKKIVDRPALEAENS